jgi:ABC-type cobalamin/Fe3+-siderophores transport system ATPase subunit
MSLSVRDLRFAYQKTPVLSGVTFDAAPGELLAILGPNGVGKTTLFRCILGEQRRYAGTIEIDGTDAGTLSAREREIILLRFGLPSGPERTQKEVADRLGISQSYISRLEKRIIGSLRREMQRMMQV